MTSQTRQVVARLEGVVPPIVTPLTPRGAVDVESLRKVARHLVDAGVHGIFALGSTGESAYLADDDRALVLETIVTEVGGAIPVLAGVVDLSANRVANHALAAAAAGADAIVAVSPIYALNDRAEVDRHFRMVAACSPLPVYAYDIPVRVGTKLAPDLLVELGADGVIAGVKDSSGDDVTFRRLLAMNRAEGSPLVVLSGHEVLADAMLLLGADGVVPGLANVDAAGYVRLWHLTKALDWQAAVSEQERLNALFEIVHQARARSIDASGVGAFKVAMTQLGLIASSKMAEPVAELDEVAQAGVRSLLIQAGLNDEIVGHMLGA